MPNLLDRCEIITCHFNYGKCKSKVRNYERWREQFDEVKCIELSFDGEFEIADSIKLEGTEENIIWQKEALLNILIKQCTKDFIIWSDADLLFENKSTILQALLALDYKTTALQLFSKIEMLDADDQVIKSYYAGVCSNRVYRSNIQNPPGGAWAARTEFLHKIGGLPAPFPITGGGDRVFQDACLSTTSPEFNRFYTKEQLKWIREYRSLVSEHRGFTDFIHGTVKHLYHGHNKNRKYITANKPLQKFNFDPYKDVSTEKGLLAWSSHKTLLHEATKEYLITRNEDE